MTELTHLRCDRCTDDILLNLREKSRYKSNWAFITHDLNVYDICPTCWAIIAKHAGLKPKAK